MLISMRGHKKRIEGTETSARSAASANLSKTISEQSVQAEAEKRFKEQISPLFKDSTEPTLARLTIFSCLPSSKLNVLLSLSIQRLLS
jgi:hypothetical protein